MCAAVSHSFRLLTLQQNEVLRRTISLQSVIETTELDLENDESIWSDEPMDYAIEMTPEPESAVKSEGN